MADSQKAGDEQPELPTTLDQAKGAQAGDVTSWEKLGNRLRPWLAAQLVGINLAPGIEVEDLVGEVFYKVCRDIADFDVEPGASFRGWLLTIADHSNTDLWRAYRAQKRGAGKSVQLTDTGEVRIPDHREQRQSAIARSKEAHGFLQKALAKLSAKRRTVTELRMLEGLDYKDIAERMGYDNPETVRILYHHARKQLQGLMAPLRETRS